MQAIPRSDHAPNGHQPFFFGLSLVAVAGGGLAGDDFGPRGCGQGGIAFVPSAAAAADQAR